MEAQRLGLRAYASDLNPVPVLINKALIEIPPKFAGRPPVNPESRKGKLKTATWTGAQGLAEDVRYYGQWMRDEAEKRIGHLYPKVEVTAEMAQDRPDLLPYVGQQLTVIAWLWARTVKCPNPACGAITPLICSFNLSSRTSNRAYVKPVTDKHSQRVTLRAAYRGIDERQVKLGCVQPGESVATFGDALRRLTDSATYLYVDGKRYWYSTQPTFARLADDRAGELSDDQVTDEIVKRLREEARTRADFSKVHACVQSSDVPDEKEVRLVILSPEFPHSNKDPNSLARREAASILDSRGSSPRNYKNTLVFLAGDANRLRELEQAVRQFLAWSTIWDDKVTLNLDQFQSRQAETKRKSANEAVDLRIAEAYQWLLVPGQPDPKGDLDWTDLKLQGHDSLATRAAKKLKNEESLLVQMGAVRLRTELDRIPLWTGNHVSIKQLCEYMARYLYLPRLRDEQVLIAAIQDGVSSLIWQDEGFAYAESWDEARGRYQGLKFGTSIRVVVDNKSLLVKPEAAASQIANDQEVATASVDQISSEPGTATFVSSNAVGSSPTSALAVPLQKTGQGKTHPAVPKLTRFHGSTRLDPLRMGRDASRIAEEVIQHLSGLVGAEVEITLEIQVRLPDGASDKLVRDVTENCRTLKFSDFGFEDE